MKLDYVSVRNYKGLRQTDCKLSDFVCAIGENNVGKSSLLQALLLFVNGTKLSKAEFYELNEDILITVTLKEVSAEVLGRLTAEHCSKIQPFVRDETLILARRYSPDGSSKLRVVTSIPREVKFRSSEIDSAFKGTKGKEIGEVLLTLYGEATTPEEAGSCHNTDRS